jgi:deoxyribose-phosphate aldolase
MSKQLRAIAKLIDHAELHPSLTDHEIAAGCEMAGEFHVASVCVKPYAVPLAASILDDSDVAVGTVVGYPHGGHATNVKVEEALRACSQGAAELDMVVNIGKVLGDDWDYVEQEIRLIYEAATSQEALLKVIFENAYLMEDRFKIRLCEICGDIGVAFVKTSTGFGFVKQADGGMRAIGAKDYDLQLMRKHCPEHVGIKASGCIRTFDSVLHMKGLGATRIGTSSTQVILEEAITRGYTK